MNKWVIVIFGCLYGLYAEAQDFKVKSFRLLQNDITAWVNPVKDLNDEACALVKVVGDADFAFSSPLGIVARRNEVGEIWIYLPKGTTHLTIKHPRWGVLRDFRFPNPLESRLTYELIVEGPPEKEEASPFPKVRHRPLAGIWNEWREPVMTTSPVGKQRGIPPVYFLLATCGIQEHEQAPGLMVGLMKRHGIYVHGQTNFRHLPTQGECDEEGRLAGEEAVPYYEPGADHGLWTLTAGGIHRLFGLWHVYEGIGYGERKTVWETREGLRVRNTDYSVKGFAAEVGCLVECRRWTFAAGVVTIRGDYWLPSIGVGIHF